MILKKSIFFRSFLIQLRVIDALLMREILTRYGRHNIGFLWLFIEPMLFTLGVTALWTFSGGHKLSSIPIAAFALTGYSSVLIWRNMPNRCCGAIVPNLALMYHRNVKVFDIYISRVLLELAGSTASFFILGAVFFTIGWIELPDNMLKVLMAWGLLAWFGMAFGFLVGALSERLEVVEKLWHPMSYLLFPLSGAAFMVDWLPNAGQEFVLMLPMVHGTEMLREGYFGTQIHAYYDISYFLMANLIITFCSLYMIRIVSRNVVPE